MERGHVAEMATHSRSWKEWDPTDYALTTLPLRRHPVHTRMRLLPCAVLACTGRRLMFQRRLVMLCAWLTLFPERGFLPQTSQTCAIATGSDYESGGNSPERPLAVGTVSKQPQDLLKFTF